MKKRGHAVQYPPGVGGVIGKFYNMLMIDGHVDSKLLAKVLSDCPGLYDKAHFLNTLLLQPQTDQQREWIEAFGLAWGWTGILYRSQFPEEDVFGNHQEDEDALMH